MNKQAVIERRGDRILCTVYGKTDFSLCNRLRDMDACHGGFQGGYVTYSLDKAMYLALLGLLDSYGYQSIIAQEADGFIME